MATFVFKAMDLAGVPAQGEVEAESKQDVAEQLKQRGLIVLDIASKYRTKELNIELFSRVKADEMAIMTRQLAESRAHAPEEFRRLAGGPSVPPAMAA